MTNADERTGFNVVKATVGDKVLNHLTSQREKLDFIKNDARTSRDEFCASQERKLREKGIQIKRGLLKKQRNCGIYLRKIQVYECLVLTGGKGSCQSCFSDATSSFNQKSRLSASGLFPVL